MTAEAEAVVAATAGVARLYPVGTSTDVMVKDDRGRVKYPYGVFSAVLGRGDGHTLDSTHGFRHGAVNVQTFGRTADSALDHMEQIGAALRDEVLDLPGCTPLRETFDTPRVLRDPDDGGVIGATQQFTFTAGKES